MSALRYVCDTSASRRTRAVYSDRCDISGDAISNKHHNKTNKNNDAASSYHCGIVKKSNCSDSKWDQMSVDSGFSSDFEHKVALLSMSGSEVKSVDKSHCDIINPGVQRAPSRAKYPADEKRKRNKIWTLPSSDCATSYHCNDVFNYISVDNDVKIWDITSSTAFRACNRESGKKSRTLPFKRDRKNEIIVWDDVSLSDLRQVRVLGRGGYAQVDLVEMKRQPGYKFALKKMRKRLLQDRDQVDHVISEKEVLKHARSRFIPRLYRTFQTSNHVFMLTEACLGGDLFSVLETHGALHCDVTRYILACVLEALDHLHRVLGVIHRDVKTENILIDANGNAKLADLGFCKRLPDNCNSTRTFCGTPGYVAPEVLLRTGHGKVCDFFSTGVVLFEVATCRSPFRRRSTMETHRATLKGIKDVAFPSFIDIATIQLVQSLCCNDPNRRIGAGGCEQIRQHDFFREFEWHCLRQGRMTSPLLNMTPRLSDHVSPATLKGGYSESSTDIIKNSRDKIWFENF